MSDYAMRTFFLLIDFTKVIVFWGRLWVNVGKKYTSPSCLDADECFPGQI